MNDPYLAFDRFSEWGDTRIGTCYDLEVFAGSSSGWLPHIEIKHPANGLTYHFIRSFDEVGVYTPGYAIGTPLTGGFWDLGVYPVPEELPVPKWMPVAIERAGFGYDPVPNSERRKRPIRELTHPDQQTLGGCEA